MKNNIDDFM